MTRSQARRRKKKRILIATLCVAAMIVGGLTFAWYTSQDSVVNTFKATGNFNTVIVENFTPPTNWEPGTTTDKVVQVTNTGTIDAFVRVNLTPVLEYDKKITTTDEDSNTTYSTTPVGSYSSTGTYAIVDAAAIDLTAENYNTLTDTDTFSYGEYTKYEGGNEWNGVTIPSGVTLYVKESTAESTVNGEDTVVETGKNYDLMGYYTAEDGTTYELNIEIDNTDAINANKAAQGEKGLVYEYTPSTDAETGETVYTATLLSKISFSLYNVTHYSTSDTSTTVPYGVDDLVTINYYNADETEGYDTENWHKDEFNGIEYYYYRHVLSSGATTTPLIESVTFNEDFDDTDVSNITFDLTVDQTSTQAIWDAAAAAYGATASTPDTNALFTSSTSSDGGTTYVAAYYKDYVIQNYTSNATSGSNGETDGTGSDDSGDSTGGNSNSGTEGEGNG